MDDLDKIKKSQRKYWWIGAGVLGVSVSGVIVLKLNQLETESIEKPKEVLTTGLERIDAKEIWIDNIENDRKLDKARIDSLQQTLEQIVKNQEAAKIETAKQALEVQNVTHQDVGLRTENQDQKIQKKDDVVNPFENAKTTAQSHDGIVQEDGIQKITVELTPRTQKKMLKTVDNTIPSGSYVPSILLGGVDASTSIQASNNPQPVLLRLTHVGSLPRKFKSDVKGCRVLAATYGDLSSERVFMRLERMSCVERATGEIIDIKVTGYVAGEDGRAGLRGIVVDKAGPVVRNAAVGGFLSGIGNFMSQAKSPITFSPSNGLAQTNPLDTNEMLRQGSAKGASSALEKYADFYIKRAEQLQPVIEIQAGRAVDIVFTEPVSLGDGQTRKAVSLANDQERHDHINDISGQGFVNEVQEKPL